MPSSNWLPGAYTDTSSTNGRPDASADDGSDTSTIGNAKSSDE